MRTQSRIQQRFRGGLHASTVTRGANYRSRSYLNTILSYILLSLSLSLYIYIYAPRPCFKPPPPHGKTSRKHQSRLDGSVPRRRGPWGVHGAALRHRSSAALRHCSSAALRHCSSAPHDAARGCHPVDPGRAKRHPDRALEPQNEHPEGALDHQDEASLCREDDRDSRLHQSDQRYGEDEHEAEPAGRLR